MTMNLKPEPVEFLSEAEKTKAPRADDLPVLPDGPRKCVLDERGSVKACRTLSSAVGTTGFSRAKGIVCWSFIDFTDASVPPRHMYGCRDGIHTKHGLLFNFCPFCGETIHKQPDKADEVLP